MEGGRNDRLPLLVRYTTVLVFIYSIYSPGFSLDLRFWRRRNLRPRPPTSSPVRFSSCCNDRRRSLIFVVADYLLGSFIMPSTMGTISTCIVVSALSKLRPRTNERDRGIAAHPQAFVPLCAIPLTGPAVREP